MDLRTSRTLILHRQRSAVWYNFFRGSLIIGHFSASACKNACVCATIHPTIIILTHASEELRANLLCEQGPALARVHITAEKIFLDLCLSFSLSLLTAQLITNRITLLLRLRTRCNERLELPVNFTLCTRARIILTLFIILPVPRKKCN